MAGAPGGGGSGGGLLLVHDADLLGVLDQWVASLGAEEFVEVLPLLRRTFGGFTEPERAAIGRAARALGDAGRTGRGQRERPLARAAGGGIDAARAAGAARTVALILGGGAVTDGAARHGARRGSRRAAGGQRGGSGAVTGTPRMTGAGTGTRVPEQERLRRWRLLLGSCAAPRLASGR